MKITAFQLGLLRTPLKTPFQTALRRVECMEEVVVLLHTDTGYTGYGSAPPTAAITGETNASIIEAIRAHIGPAVIGQDVGFIHHNADRVQTAIVHNRSAKAAVDMALYDLWAQQHGAPLYQLLGGGEPCLDTDITISLAPLECMLEAALSALEHEFDILKIKLGGTTQDDIEQIRAIWAAIKGQAALRLDPNQGWSVAQTLTIMRALEQNGLELELLEQPIAATDIHGLKQLSQQIQTPIVADESIATPQHALALIAQRAVASFNIKLMKSGGIQQALCIADVAAIHEMPCMMGSMLESTISVTAAAHVAVARADTINMIDLDGPLLAQRNFIEGGAVFDGPNISLPDTPGLGITGIQGLELLVG